MALARAWMDPGHVTDQWLSEGLAAWLGRRVMDESCAAPDAHPGPGEPDLDTWMAVDSSELIPLSEWQWSSACNIIETAAGVIGDQAMYALVRELVSAPADTSPSMPTVGDEPRTLAELERAAIERALDEAGGDKNEAARRLGISRAKIYQRLKEWREQG